MKRCGWRCQWGGIGIDRVSCDSRGLVFVAPGTRTVLSGCSAPREDLPSASHWALARVSHVPLGMIRSLECDGASLNDQK